MKRIIPLLLLTLGLSGCATPENKTLVQARFEGTGLEAVQRMVLLLEALLKQGKSVNLSIPIEAAVDPAYFSDGPDGVRDIKKSAEVPLKREIRESLSKYPKFTIVDIDGLDTLSNANYILTLNIFYSNEATWSGKLIDLKTNRTIGEYYCASRNGGTVAFCN